MRDIPPMPHDDQLERMVLAQVIHVSMRSPLYSDDADLWDRAKAILYDPMVFYNPMNRDIYEAILAVDDSWDTIHLGTIRDELIKQGKFKNDYFINSFWDVDTDDLIDNAEMLVTLYHSRLLIQAILWQDQFIDKCQSPFAQPLVYVDEIISKLENYKKYMKGGKHVRDTFKAA